VRFDAITLFPQMFETLSQFGVTRRAHERGCGSFAPGIRAISRWTFTARWTTGRSAADRAWC